MSIEDDKYILESYKAALAKKTITAVDAVKISADYYYDKLVSPSDQLLLDLAFQKNLTQEKLDKFLSEWDIEAEGSYRALLLSYIMKQHPDLAFDEYNGPRLKGLLNFYKFANLGLISHYTKIVRALNEHGIVPMIMKGGLMKYLRPELSRCMGDIDILIFDDEDYEKSKKIVHDLGYDYEQQDHSIDLHVPGSEAGVLDIHSYIDIGSKYDKTEIINNFKKRATKTKVFGCETYIPCTEDSLFIGLVNLAKNVRNKTSVRGVLFYLFDFEYLKNSKPDLDWNIVVDNIRLTGAYSYMIVAIEFANKAVPGIVPDVVANSSIVRHNVKRHFNWDVYYYKYVEDVRAKSGSTKIRDVHSLKDFSKYLKIKFTKQVRWFVLQHPTLTDLWLKIASKYGDK